MAVRAEPKIVPSNVVQVVKSISAREFSHMYSDIKMKYFWAQSYFVESVGNANEEVIRQYVQGQLKVMNSSEKSSRQLGLF